MEGKLMRKIKFRAWDKLNKKIVTSGLSINIDTTDRVIPVSFTQGDIAYCRDNDVNSVPNIHSDIELMQYTGLKDKNGVEIYEHDIVKILYSDWPSQLDSYPELSHDEYLDSLTYKAIVVWDQYGFWLVDKIGGYPQSIIHGQHGYIEVIGNIYDNPEALKGSK